MTKFEIGDKVRILYTGGAPLAGFEVGDIVEIYASKFDGSKSDGLAEFSVVKDNGTCGHCDEIHIEKVSPSPTKKQRLTHAEKAITALEQQVAELQAEVATLKQASKPKYTLNGLLAQAPKSPNEQRKAIIAEAKAFVAVKSEYIKDSTRTSGGYKRKVIENPKYSHMAAEEVVFHTNGKKRVVTAVVKYSYGEVMTKAIAKCAPDDVFNADIGKAIALGRALGLDVKRFEQAVKPTEVVVGMEVEVVYRGGGILGVGVPDKVVKKGGRFLLSRNGEGLCVGGNYSTYRPEDGARITDDTGAQY